MAERFSQERQAGRGAGPEPSTAHEPRLCPVCGGRSPAEALFCGECGHNFQVPERCPSCGGPLPPEADICERCGAWTGGTGCRLCGHPLSGEARYCPACGAPRDGIPCPQCGTVSYFDFCPRCHACLTEAGRAELLAAAREPAGKRPVQRPDAGAQNSSEDSASTPGGAAPREDRTVPLKDRTAGRETRTHTRDRAGRRKERSAGAADLPEGAPFDEAGDLARLKRYLRGERVVDDRDTDDRVRGDRNRPVVSEVPADTHTDRPSGKPSASGEEPGDVSVKDSGAEPRIDRLLERRLEASGKIVFSGNQEARRYHMARKPHGALGWLCNKNGLLHPDPMSCNASRFGGRWVSEWNGITRPEDIEWGTVNER